MPPTGDPSLLDILRDLLDAGRDPTGREALARCRRHLEAAGFKVELHDDVGALVMRTSPDATLLFSGHVDVVPAGAGWTRDPYGGEVAENRVWGRGACDMLGSVAAYLKLAYDRPDLPFAIALTSDEETGMKGAEALVARGALAGLTTGVVGEPTDFEIGVAEKGVLWLRLTARGVSAHASMPEKGRNAISLLVAGLARLHDLPIGPRHLLLGAPTASVGRLAGGTAVNMVPDTAWAEVDIRYCPPQTEAGIVQAVEEAMAATGAPVTVEVLSHHAPFEASPASGLGKTAERALRMSRDAPPRAVGLPYGTEASKLVALGMDLIVLGPGERALAHTNGESITLQDLEDGYTLYRTLAELHAKGGR